jgi:hypothetical protein
MNWDNKMDEEKMMRGKGKRTLYIRVSGFRR